MLAKLTATCLTLTLLAPGAPAQTLPCAGDCARLREQMERLGEPALKTLYLACSDESARRPLAFDEAARCSIAAEVLKVRVFAGDFDALLAWWRRQRPAP